MLFVDNHHEHDPAVNLALEEYVLRNAPSGEDLLLFYVNAPSIIIGRHQNTVEEINRGYVEQNGVKVVRRLSGGGAVYHDLGNLNFSFITDASPENFRNFRKFTEPVVRALESLGVPAEMSGRNDLLVEGRKISGNAQYISKGRMASHGTLLFDTNLEHVAEALNVQGTKITSKGIKSVRSRVANISEFLAQPMTVETFREYLLAHIFNGAHPVPELQVSAVDWTAVRALAESRYRSWDWTYGASPDFNVEKRQRFAGGEIDARLDVQQGVIRAVKFYGDFFAEVEPDALEQKLVGVRYTRADIDSALREEPVGRYFSGMDHETFGAFLA